MKYFNQTSIILLVIFSIFAFTAISQTNNIFDDYYLTIYPGEMVETGTFKIGLEGFSGKTVQMNIQDANGTLVYSKEISITQTNELTELNAAIISNPGMYTVSISQSDDNGQVLYSKRIWKSEEI